MTGRIFGEVDLFCYGHVPYSTDCASSRTFREVEQLKKSALEPPKKCLKKCLRLFGNKNDFKYAFRIIKTYIYDN